MSVTEQKTFTCKCQRKHALVMTTDKRCGCGRMIIIEQDPYGAGYRAKVVDKVKSSKKK